MDDVPVENTHRKLSEDRFSIQPEKTEGICLHMATPQLQRLDQPPVPVSSV